MYIIKSFFRWLYQKVAYIIHIFILGSADRYVVRFTEYMPESDKVHIVKAYCLAFKLHYGQYRGDGVTSYFSHCLDLGNFISVELGIKNDWKINVAALIHDTVEDGNILIEKIARMFGTIVANWTRLMTKGEGYKKDHSSYITNIREAMIIELLILKLGDRIVNLRTLGMKNDPKFQIKQINETIQDYLPLAELLINLMYMSEEWKDRVYVGFHIITALENQILSFRHEYGDSIINTIYS